MKSYFRFLTRNKLYTTIEVFGMAIAYGNSHCVCGIHRLVCNTGI